MGLAVSGYQILIGMIAFFNFISLFSPQFKFPLRRWITHSRRCLTIIPKTLKFIEKYSAMHHIFNSVLIVWKHGQTCSFVLDIITS